MNVIFIFAIFLLLTLSLVNSALGSCLSLPEWVSYLPWNKDIPEDQYKDHIAVHLVDKNWSPEIHGMPKKHLSPDRPYAMFPGSHKDAYTTFKDVKGYDSRKAPLVDALELLRGPHGYDSKVESIFLVTTLPGDAKDPMIKNIILAIAMRNMLKKYNIFVIDLKDLNKSMGITVTREIFGSEGNYNGVSNAIYTFIKNAVDGDLMKVEGIHMVGYAYSAKLIGYIARAIRTNREKKVKSLLVLEPHSTGWEMVRSTHIFIPSREDAEVVHTYHTTSLGLGTFRRDATVDVVFNNGFTQPGCGVSLRCSNMRVVVMLWYIILYPEKFIGRQCTSVLDFYMCKCKKNETHDLTFPPSGDYKGALYLRTNSKPPFAYEEDGADNNCR